MSDSALRARVPGLVIATLFFVAGCLALDDFGVTWDEPETFAASGRDWIRAELTENRIQWIDHEVEGYFFVFDQSRAVFATLMRSLGWLDLVRSYHLFQLLLSALALYLLYRLAFELSGRVRPAATAAIALAAMPTFVAHSQNNPKDLPALFVFVGAIHAATTWLRRGGAARAVSAGVWLGVAGTSRTLSILIPPIVAAWAIWTAPGRLRELRTQAGLLAGIAMLAFCLSWPALWSEGPGGLLAALATVSKFTRHAPQVLYLGDVFRGVDLPWHYFPVRLWVALPIFFWLAIACNALPRLPAPDDDRGLARLGLVWIGGVGVTATLAGTHYDGVRHFLMILPALAIAVATGLEAVWARVRGATVWAARIAVAAGAASVVAAHVATHPYQVAYLNEVTNAAISGEAEDVFDVEYWGDALKEGSEWLVANAEPDAEVQVPWVGLANFYLSRPGVPFDPRQLVSDGPPRYLMVFTRKSRYDDFLHFVDRECEPVFRVRRQRATLLAVYRGRDVRDALVRTGTQLAPDDEVQ